jgi:hypothetical protein
MYNPSEETPRGSADVFPPEYSHPVRQVVIDGGYSGRVAVTRAHGDNREIAPDMVFVDTERLGRLQLSMTEAAALRAALVVCLGAARASSS